MNFFFIFIISFLCTACTTAQYTQGHFLLHQQIKSLAVGKINKQQIINELGPPQLKSLFGQKTWYYIGIKKRTIMSFAPKIIHTAIYALTFDNHSVLSKIQYFTEKNKHTIIMEQNITPLPNTNSTLLKKLFGNLGAIMPITPKNAN